MNKIKYLFSVETPELPSRRQALIFTVVSSLVLFTVHLVKSTSLTFPLLWAGSLFLIFPCKPEWIQKLLQLTLKTLFVLIHTLSLIGLSLVYFCLLLPMGLYMVSFVRDPLRRKAPMNSQTYFLDLDSNQSHDFLKPY